jgi:hypothetical protein
MRVFVYGMQSSGASLATYLLGQIPEAVVLVDLYSYELMPAIEAPQATHVIGKAVVTTSHTMAEHVESFRPDRSILLLRDPVQNYVALSRKGYAHDDGQLDDKFRRLNEVFQQRQSFDLVLRYEDVVANPPQVVAALRRIGFPASLDMWAFPRSRDEITAYNLQHSSWCRERFGRGWSFGNIHGERMQQSLVHKLAPRHVHDAVTRLCPDVVAFYSQMASATGPAAYAVGMVRDTFARPAIKALRLTGRNVRAGIGSLVRSIRALGRS